MKVLVIFGSTSDKMVYEPLVEGLSSVFTTGFEVISAHRNHKRLAEALENKDYDFVVAGAGLAAHLPGVVASQVSCPVFGIPVNSLFGGIDAFLSVLQMPFGVPVLTCAPGEWHDVGDWCSRAKTYEREDFQTVNVVVHPMDQNYEYAKREIDRLKDYAKEREVELVVVEELVSNKINLVLASRQDMIKSFKKEKTEDRTLVMHSYIMDKMGKGKDPYSAFELFKTIDETGGLWVGVNNSRNGLSALLKWRDIL